MLISIVYAIIDHSLSIARIQQRYLAHASAIYTRPLWSSVNGMIVAELLFSILTFLVVPLDIRIYGLESASYLPLLLLGVAVYLRSCVAHARELNRELILLSSTTLKVIKRKSCSEIDLSMIRKVRERLRYLRIFTYLENQEHESRSGLLIYKPWKNQSELIEFLKRQEVENCISLIHSDPTPSNIVNIALAVRRANQLSLPMTHTPQNDSEAPEKVR